VKVQRFVACVRHAAQMFDRAAVPHPTLSC
jgi:hypothetical protein